MDPRESVARWSPGRCSGPRVRHVERRSPKTSASVARSAAEAPLLRAQRLAQRLPSRPNEHHHVRVPKNDHLHEVVPSVDQSENRPHRRDTSCPESRPNADRSHALKTALNDLDRLGGLHRPTDRNLTIAMLPIRLEQPRADLRHPSQPAERRSLDGYRR